MGMLLIFDYLLQSYGSLNHNIWYVKHIHRFHVCFDVRLYNPPPLLITPLLASLFVLQPPPPHDNATASKSVCLTPTIKQQSLTDIFVWEIHKFRFLVVCLKSIRDQWIDILNNIAFKSSRDECVLSSSITARSHTLTFLFLSKISFFYW